MDKRILIYVLAFMLLALPARAAGAKAAPDSFTVKVITYNIAGLPDAITSNRKLTSTKDRFAYIGEKLKNYDIVAVQEAFISQREIIEKKLGSYYVVHGTDNSRVSTPGSGVYTFSKWPVTESHYEKWEHLAGADALSLKGFVAATIVVSPELSIDVYNLHGQTGKTEDKYDIKIKNFARLAKYMDYQSGGSGRPVLLLGDFNVKAGDPVWKSIVEGMGVAMIPDPVEKRPDHIFYKENGSGWKITVVDTGTDFTEPLKGERLSDHFAIQTTLRFDRVN